MGFDMITTKEELQKMNKILETKLDSLSRDRECIAKDRDTLLSSLSEANRNVENLEYRRKTADDLASHYQIENYTLVRENTALRGNLDILKEVYDLREAKIRALEDAIHILKEERVKSTG